MRAATEAIRLVSDAVSLWWSRLLPLVTVFLFGYSLHLLGLGASVRIGSAHPVVATVVFVLAVLVRVAGLVVALWLCRPPGDREQALDVIATVIGPFLAVYAVWGLVDDEVYELFAANIAVSGTGGVDAWSVNLRWLSMYAVLAVVAWILRQVVGLVARRHRHRPLLLLGVVLEGVWTFASALAVLAGIGRLLAWLTSRALWQGLLSGWYGFLWVLPDLSLPFDLTLPEAIARAIDWLVTVLAPAVWSALLLPLVWLALTAVVYGWRRLDAQTLVAGTALDVAHADFVHRIQATRSRRLLHATGLLLTSDLRTKYVPVLQAFRLLWQTGLWFLAAYLVVVTALQAARSWATLGLAHLLGPRDPYLVLTWDWLDTLAIELPFTTAAIALYAAATRRALLTVPELTVPGLTVPGLTVPGLTVDGTPTGGWPGRPTTGP